MRYVLIFLSMLIATPAFAQEEQKNCAPFDIIKQFHAEKLGETLTALAVIGSGEQLLAVFISPNGETWSEVVVDHEGIGCLAVRGTDWQTRHDPAPVEEQPL